MMALLAELMGIQDNVLGSLTAKINDSLVTAKNDLRSSMAKTFTAAASSLSSDQQQKFKGGKAKYFSAFLEHSKRAHGRFQNIFTMSESNSGKFAFPKRDYLAFR